MRKVLFAALAAALIVACSGKKAASWADLSGEWNVVSIDGTEVVVDSLSQQPFIGFNGDGSIYGCAGCNRIIGSTNVGEDPTVADFSKLGTTMMMCPNMELEESFLSAMKDVKSYYVLDDQHIEFAGASGDIRMVLERK